VAFGTSRGDGGARAAPIAELREALARVLAGDLAGAESVLAEAARADSSSIDLYLALATVYRSRGAIGRAIQIHQNVLLRRELPPALRREALLGLAFDFRAGGFLRRSVASFRELLEHEPRNLDALRELERLYIETSEWLDAIALRRRIGSADPRSPTILAHLWTGLGRGQLREGRAAEAQRSFRRGIKSDRRCAEPYVALGELRLQEQRTRKAIGLWRRALSLHPRAGTVLFPLLWEAFEREGDLEGFVSLVDEHRRAVPADLEAVLWSSRARIRMGQTEQGLSALRRMLDAHPDYFPAYVEVGRALLGEGRDAESVKAFEELLAHLPASPTRLRCKSCGAHDSQLRWRCPQCGEWDSFA
jgi:lipopolysaccharide assembly protein B